MDSFNGIESNIHYKHFFFFAEDEYTQQEGNEANNQAVKKRFGLGTYTVYQDRTHKANDVIQGIELVDGQEIIGNNGVGIEDGGQIHQEHREDIPQELCITEEYHQGCQDQAYAVSQEEEHN